MTKSLGIDVHPLELELAKEIERSNKSFRDLKFENQRVLVECSLSLDGIATEEEIKQYRIEKQIRDAETPLETIHARTRRLINNANRNLRVR